MFNRAAGAFLVFIGMVGFLTVADDLRHVGEFVGAASILLSGLILLAGSLKLRLVKCVPVRWMALGILSGIILGAGLDNMVLGVGIGLTVGTGVGFLVLRRQQSEKREPS